MDTHTRDAPTAVDDAPGGEQAPAPFPPTDGVYGQLFREGYRFSFYQAVRLLEKWFGDAPSPGSTWDVRRERILFRPDTALVFPAADLKRVEASPAPSPHARLVMTFSGLYGVDSPLPSFFYEDIAAERSGTEPLRAFLDLFNHRLYAFFYRAWSKYRPEAVRGTRRFLSVAGLDVRGLSDGVPLPNPQRLAALAGWLAPHARHAEGLRKVLEIMLGGRPVRIEENVLRWVDLPARPRMGGEGLRLGGGAVLGARIPDRSGKFRVVLGPLTFSDYLTFRPGEANAELLAFLLRLYAPDYLDYDVEVIIDASGIPPVRLGARDVSLGGTAWLGAPATGTVTICMN